jgi:hypothetical protein
MKRLALSALALCLSACAGGPSADVRGFEPRIANPSAIIAAEIAFNQLAQAKGQWTAFRETVAKDAVMFVPQPVLAQDWLKGKADPPASVKWQPHKAFMSCDGKTGVTTGAWQRPNGTVGYFTTVWQFIQKDERGDGTWKWVMDHGDGLTAPRVPTEMIETKVASCKGRAPAALVAPAEGAKMKSGFSRDQSLSYTWVVQPDGARTVEVKLWNGEAAETVIIDRVAAQQ